MILSDNKLIFIIKKNSLITIISTRGKYYCEKKNCVFLLVVDVVLFSVFIF